MEWPPDEEEGAELAPALAAFDVMVPGTASLTGPYWLREPREPYRYTWPEEGPLGLPFDEPAITATWELRLGSDHLSLVRPAKRRESFVGGSRELSPEVVPPVSLRPREERKLLPASRDQERLELQLAARSMRDGVTGTLRVDLPDGWDANPVEAELAYPRSGDVRTTRLEVVIPADAKPGVHDLRYRVETEDRDYGVVLQPVRRRAPGLAGPVDESNCVAETFVPAPATVSIHLIEAEFVRRLKHAYIRGADEGILSSLEHFGLDVTVLGAEDAGVRRPRAYDDIVVGPNTYLLGDVRGTEPAAAGVRRAGGTLIVQYQGYGYEGEGSRRTPSRYRQPARPDHVPRRPCHHPRSRTIPSSPCPTGSAPRTSRGGFRPRSVPLRGTGQAATSRPRERRPRPGAPARRAAGGRVWARHLCLRRVLVLPPDSEAVPAPSACSPTCLAWPKPDHGADGAGRTIRSSPPMDPGQLYEVARLMAERSLDTAR